MIKKYKVMPTINKINCIFAKTLKILVMYFIYVIISAHTKDVIYVGQTKNPSKRFYDHKTRSIEKLKTKEIEFKILHIEENKKMALLKEQGEILNQIRLGAPLVNYQKNNYSARLCFGFNEKKELVEVKKGKGHYFNRHSYKGLFWNDKNEFPKWKVDALNKAKKIQQKKVYQFTKQGELVAEFDGVREAFRETGIDHRSISAICTGANPNRHTAGGFKWSYNKHLNT